MSVADITQAPTSSEDDFVLDVRVIEDDALRPAAQKACDTSNGCPPSCASSCNSAA
ncbi:FxLD family lanthipeptide [Actinomadura sp. 7K507]|uniref:FxLD family lanthipeptide n=1 Tax=Actinomadura sp. 7K507 TaxID=2530365 RepID=UPI0010540B1B|nr:FxLD family lanthipeptide [Actinomadura sp. 7K507]TDC97255.1 FxLD family lantipeptide [Actinomadura sp. 7K507]